MQGKKAALAIHDPPYNVSINTEFDSIHINEYIQWYEKW